MSSTTPAFGYFPSAISQFDPPLIRHTNHFLGDISSSDKYEPDKPISAGIYRFEPGKELEITYSYTEMKVILEGEGTVEDVGTGKTVTVRPGDVLEIPKGVTLKFKTDTFCKAFYVAQRKEYGK